MKICSYLLILQKLMKVSGLQGCLVLLMVPVGIHGEAVKNMNEVYFLVP